MARSQPNDHLVTGCRFQCAGVVTVLIIVGGGHQVDPAAVGGVGRGVLRPDAMKID